jgi:hypothetical protein
MIHSIIHSYLQYKLLYFFFFYWSYIGTNFCDKRNDKTKNILKNPWFCLYPSWNKLKNKSYTVQKLKERPTNYNRKATSREYNITCRFVVTRLILLQIMSFVKDDGELVLIRCWNCDHFWKHIPESNVGRW